MNFYWNASKWDSPNITPSVSINAKAKRPIKVTESRVIHIQEATYRRAKISGTFLLGGSNNYPLPTSGWQRVEVICCWFESRLQTRGPRFKVNMSTAKVDEKYDGYVLTDLSV